LVVLHFAALIATAGNDCLPDRQKWELFSTAGELRLLTLPSIPRAVYRRPARTTLATKGIDDFDMEIEKEFSVTQSKGFELAAQSNNVLALFLVRP
jgi:hypothetical protein